MPQCAVKTCHNAYHKTKNKVCYHRFPNESDVRDKWVKIIGRSDPKNPLNTSTARVCSLHFSPTCYDRDIAHELFGLPARKRLRKGALPDLCVPRPPSQRNQIKSIENAEKARYPQASVGSKGGNVNSTKTTPRTPAHSPADPTGVSPKAKVSPADRIKFDPEIHIDITSFRKNLSKLIAPPPETRIDTYQLAENPHGILIAIGLNPKIKSLNRMQIMDGSECEKPASIEEEAPRPGKLSLLSNALLSRAESKVAASTPDNGLVDEKDAEKPVKREKSDNLEDSDDVPPSSVSEAPESVLVNGVHSDKSDTSDKSECAPKEEEDDGEGKASDDKEVKVEQGTTTESDEWDSAKDGQEDAVGDDKTPDDKVPDPTPRDLEKEDAVASDDDDRQSIASSDCHSNQVNDAETDAEAKTNVLERSKERKRRLENDGSSYGSDSDSAPQYKKLHQMEDGVEEDAREKLVREYLEQSAMSLEDMNQSADKLQREISTLGELARAKELEWNSILRLRKLKEEMLERLLRKRRQYFISSSSSVQEWENATAAAAAAANPILNNDKDSKKLKKPLSALGMKQSNHAETGNNLMMVPIVSSSPSNVPSSQLNGDKASIRTASHLGSNPCSTSSSNSNPNCNFSKMQRPILPKPPSHLSASALLELQNSVIGEGRQGPILDVKSIIADYRSRHPEQIPRRGRRPIPIPQQKIESPIVSSTRFSGSPALMSMANLALGTGSQVRTIAPSQDFLNNFHMVHDASRPSSADSLKNTDTNLSHVQTTSNVSFKDVLVHFAKMKQDNLSSPAGSPQTNMKQSSAQPPPYPEVTLHPVSAPQSPPPAQTSLLHGILTKSNSQIKNNSNSQHRPTAFSPTLARLLTAPEKSSRTMRFQDSPATSPFRPPVNNKTISDIFTPCKKSRNEITITPVSTISPVQKSKDEVVLLDDEEEGSDRLVIDESASEPVSEVPECQGCHQRSAQFVCAGCGNQWYCSRECQVEAWEEHSEQCSEH